MHDNRVNRAWLVPETNRKLPFHEANTALEGRQKVETSTQSSQIPGGSVKFIVGVYPKWKLYAILVSVRCWFEVLLMLFDIADAKVTVVEV